MLGWRRVRERRGCLPRGGCCYLDVVPEWVPYLVQNTWQNARAKVRQRNKRRGVKFICVYV